jgi:hypothetical protein
MQAKWTRRRSFCTPCQFFFSISTFLPTTSIFDTSFFFCSLSVYGTAPPCLLVAFFFPLYRQTNLKNNKHILSPKQPFFFYPIKFNEFGVAFSVTSNELSFATTHTLPSFFMSISTSRPPVSALRLFCEYVINVNRTTHPLIVVCVCTFTLRFVGRSIRPVSSQCHAYPRGV